MSFKMKRMQNHKIIYVADKNMNHQRNLKGFTLLEMLLVLVIISAILLMIINYATQKTDELRIDRASLQIQQIENAALSYYISYAKWPACKKQPCIFDATTTTDNDLQKEKYVPNVVINNPWGQPYQILNKDISGGNFIIQTSIPAGATSSLFAATTASILVGRLPLAYTSPTAGALDDPPDPAKCKAGEACYIISQVSVPGQNLNNARSVNFANIYHSGGCVPVPPCPGTDPTAMQPQIMAIPVSVSGVNDDNSLNVYPISSFTAYATGPTASALIDPTQCTSGKSDDCTADKTSFNNGFWRVCLSITTEKGVVSNNNQPSTVNMGSILAITRCAPPEEPVGSVFDVW